MTRSDETRVENRNLLTLPPYPANKRRDTRAKLQTGTIRAQGIFFEDMPDDREEALSALARCLLRCEPCIIPSLYLPLPRARNDIAHLLTAPRAPHIFATRSE